VGGGGRGGGGGGGRGVRGRAREGWGGRGEVGRGVVAGRGRRGGAGCPNQRLPEACHFKEASVTSLFKSGIKVFLSGRRRSTLV